MDPRSMEVYTRVFALDMAAKLAVPFTGDNYKAAQTLRTLSPFKVTTLLTAIYISCGE